MMGESEEERIAKKLAWSEEYEKENERRKRVYDPNKLKPL